MPYTCICVKYKDNENKIPDAVVRQLVHGLLDAEREYALKVNSLAEQWFSAVIRAQKEGQVLN